MTISKSGRVILWSTIQSKLYSNIESPITYYDTGLDIISADVNSEFTVLATSHIKGIVQFHSIADVENIYLFK